MTRWGGDTTENHLLDLFDQYDGIFRHHGRVPIVIAVRCEWMELEELMQHATNKRKFRFTSLHLTRFRILAVVVPLLLLLATNAFAFDAADFDLRACRNGFFPSEQKDIRLMRVSRMPNAYFFGDDAGRGCPEKGDICRTRLSVVYGKEVLVNKRRSGFLCAYFPVDNGDGNAGWISEQDLVSEPSPDSNPPLKGWAGRWMRGDDVIKLRLSGKSLAGHGNAYWPAKNVFPENLGGFDAESRPIGDHAEFVEDAGDSSGCKVTMTLVGTYLVVSDNHVCGGMNVTFDGIYSRAH
jgi:hypothetical protein